MRIECKRSRVSSKRNCRCRRTTVVISLIRNVLSYYPEQVYAIKKDAFEEVNERCSSKGEEEILYQGVAEADMNVEL